ncbi:hypothetical protein RvY_07044 [Ramazzottius varieornatus]|uniref:C2H2-type domain-containing protein n=1 Tax=Ramazzottius varieornatus TaxID=947166 RepID=A0A1D1V3Y5_RAMVA|nr:hypothetical protein RvY_07044 [Ramazzottius varieornatus]
MESGLWNPFRSTNTPNTTSCATISGAGPSHQSLWNHPRSGSAIAARGAALWPDGQQQNQSAFAQQFNQSQYSSRVAHPHHAYPAHDGRQFRNSDANYSGGGGYNSRGRGYGRGGRCQPFRGGRGGSSQFPSQKFANAGSHQRFQPAFYCEVCECDFRTQTQLDEHIAKHVKCPRCDFIGIFDTIEEHFELIHLTSGTKPPETAEDLAKWKQERAAKYPRVKPAAVKTTNIPVLSKPPAVRSDGDSRELSDGEIEDEETAPAGPSTKCLTSLLSCYESESDGEPEEIPTKPLPSEEKTVPLAACALDVHSLELREGRSTFAVDTRPSSDGAFPNRADSEPTSAEKTHLTERPTRSTPSRFHKTVQPYFRQSRRKPKTLYEKLVAKDLEKDNDHLLQCFAHLYK